MPGVFGRRRGPLAFIEGWDPHSLEGPQKLGSTTWWQEVGGQLPTALPKLLHRVLCVQVYSQTLHWLVGDQGWGQGTAVPLAAAAGGAALSGILSPVELIKCRMQVHGPRYTSSWHCIKEVIRQEGLRGLGRGLGATLCREIPGNMIFFSVYEGLRRVVPGSHPRGASATNLEGNGVRTWWKVVADASSAILCGGLSGIAMWTIILPLDTVKTRRQAALPNTTWDVSLHQIIRMLWSEGRFASLWSGLYPTVLRAFPANAAQWLTWELAMSCLRDEGGLHKHHYHQPTGTKEEAQE